MYAGRESQVPYGKRHVRGIAPIDIYARIAPEDEAYRQNACVSSFYDQEALQDGVVDVDEHLPVARDSLGALRRQAQRLDGGERRRVVDAIGLLAELEAGRLDLESDDAGRPGALGELHQADDAVLLAGDDDLRGRVDVGQGDEPGARGLPAESAQGLRVEPDHRGHGAGALVADLAHQPAAQADELDPVLDRDRA